MDTLKTLVMLAVLGGVGYGVYTSLHKKPAAETGGPATAAAPLAPKVDISAAPAATKPTADFAANMAKPAASDSRFSANATRLTPEPPSVPPEAKGNPVVGPGVANPGNPFARPAGVSPAAPAAPTNPPTAPSFGTAAVAPKSDAPRSNGALPFSEVWKTAQGLLADGRLAQAHRLLSTYYDDPQLTEAETRQLRDLLDQLAGTVIYSTQHHLEPAYVVQPGEQLADIAKKYEVPVELLVKINGIENPVALQPGDQLKVLRGPFQALVNVPKHELTLLLNGYYAGRFPIGVGRDMALSEPHYYIKDKLTNPRYAATGGAPLEPGDPANPLGERLLGLDGKAAIHGTNDPRNIGRDDLKGCISLSKHDIDDVYDILSVGSKIIVRR